MHLWTEYEGRTIAESYTLGKLLRSEGRNGFFATADKDGHPAVIRLTEAHFDEAEQLARWRQVAEVHQDNLIEIEQVGQTTFEGVKLTYALMEPEDANLGDVLKERPLTPAETLQVGKSVLLALRALHGRGLVHEHVRPENVMAVGETVKLRSDCVRECVPDGEFTSEEACEELRRRDLQSFGRLLLECLTLERELNSTQNLPEPFRRVVPGAMEGGWDAERLGMALDPVMFAPKPAAAANGTGPVAPVAPAVAAATLAGTQAAAESRPLVPPGVLQADRKVNGTAEREAAIPTRSRALEEEPAGPGWGKVRLGVGGLVALALLLWLVFGGSSSKKSATAPPAGRQAAEAPATTAAAPRAETQPAAAAPRLPHDAAMAAGRSGWYVIAYTYNREDQAQHKAQSLRRNHNSLHPQLFTPNGRAPFYVSLGGAMSQGEAEAVLRHAHRAGLPRDTFVRHYGGE